MLETTGEYSAENWQNFGRRLTSRELDGIRRRIAGLHFARETFADDPIALQGFYAAEALLRELDILLPDNSSPQQDIEQ